MEYDTAVQSPFPAHAFLRAYLFDCIEKRIKGTPPGAPTSLLFVLARLRLVSHRPDQFEPAGLERIRGIGDAFANLAL